MTGVYAITHTPTGRVYIGSSMDIAQRWARHRVALNTGMHHSRHLQRAWTKHGEQEFSFTTVLETEPENLRAEERRLIYELQPAFNCLRAMDSGPLRHDETTRLKMSEAQRRIWREKKEMGWTQTSEEHRAHIAAAARGRKMSPEARAKMSMSAKNRPPISEETRQKLRGRNSTKGRPFTEEHRAKLSEARRGKKLSDEHKAHIAESVKKAHEEGRHPMSSSHAQRPFDEET